MQRVLKFVTGSFDKIEQGNRSGIKYIYKPKSGISDKYYIPNQ